MYCARYKVVTYFHFIINIHSYPVLLQNTWRHSVWMHTWNTHLLLQLSYIMMCVNHISLPSFFTLFNIISFEFAANRFYFDFHHQFSHYFETIICFCINFIFIQWLSEWECVYCAYASAWLYKCCTMAIVFFCVNILCKSEHFMQTTHYQYHVFQNCQMWNKRSSHLLPCI